MGFVCDLELVSLTSGNGSYVAGAGDQLRTDERLCGRAPSAERRAPSAQPQRAPVGASAISHAHLCAARQLRNELYRNIRIKRPLSIVDSLLSSDSLTSSVKFSVCVRYEFSSFFTVYVYYCRCFIYVSFIGFTSTESFWRTCFVHCMRWIKQLFTFFMYWLWHVLRYLCVFIYSVSVAMFNSSVCCIRVIIEVSSVNRMRLNLQLDVTLRKKFSREVFTHCYVK